MAKKQLAFIIDDTKIAELFGLQNFSSPNNAILELVKNSYDAGSSFIKISFSNDKIVFQDDGVGMNASIIENKWMHVGKSDKDYSFESIDGKSRVYSGSKGIGRFALARLGSKVAISSKTKDDDAVEWITDWNDNVLENTVSFSGGEHGTIISIEKLRDQFSTSSILKLASYLGKCKDYDDFKIFVFDNGNEIKVESPYDSIDIGNNCLSKIMIHFDSKEQMLHFKMVSDEFSEEAKTFVNDYIEKNPVDPKSQKYKNINLDFYEDKVKLYDSQFDNYQDYGLELLDKHQTIIDVGDFDATLFFNNKALQKDFDKFLYKKRKFTPFDESTKYLGISLYRNSFCVAGYDGSVDWLELGKRVRTSPAAASHPSGQWRVRDNQICGYVKIDKLKNAKIEEIQNRQGIVDNVYFSIFKEIINKGLTIFEDYRQNIVRIINTKNDDYPEHNKPNFTFVDEFLKNPSAAKDFKSKDFDKLAEGMESERKYYSNREEKNQRQISEQNYVIRLMSLISTLGLKSSWKVHELHNFRNKYTFVGYNIEESLKEYGLWNLLSDNEHTKIENRNVPLLLSQNELVINKVDELIDSMLSPIKKENFKHRAEHLKTALSKVVGRWEKEYDKLSVSLDGDENAYYDLSIDVIETIFNNLILNTVQQNKNQTIDVNISFEDYSDLYLITYKDNGKGIADEFIHNPFDILKAHTTTRNDGHGLGMWIVDNIIRMIGGSIIKIGTPPGFEFQFTLGKNYGN